MPNANAFEAFAERNMTAAAKARVRRDDKRERTERLIIWKAEWQKEREAFLASPHGVAARDLIEFMKTMGSNQAADLVALIKAQAWAQADADTRFMVLRLVGDAIMALRRKQGLPEIDDPLPWGDAPPSAFIIIRELLQ